MALNHLIVAELLAEDAHLREIERRLAAARERGDEGGATELETQRLKRRNMRKLIIDEMSPSEAELYELQRDHAAE